MARSKLQVIKEILEYCRYAPKRISWIYQSLGLDSAAVPKTVGVCLKSGLLEEAPMENYLRKGYLTTKAGVEFIRKYHELTALLQETVQVG